MSDETGELTVAQRLGHLLDRGLLPAGGPAEAAERLIERLERPARIALLGLPGAGKSAVLNLLAGTVVVPETLRLPTIIVQHGAVARMLCTLADGRAETVPGSDLSQVMALNPAMVTLEMDIGALKVISLLEVSAGPMEAEQRRAAAWASKRADIVIWCTTSYLPKEQVVWESMPDAVKDNGFLFLTKVDLLGSREAAAGMLERVELRAGEEFRQVLSISAKQARAAIKPGGMDRDLFRDSGAAAVISTIKTRVQMARRADTDMAELLLARHVEASSIVAKRFADPTPEEAPVAQAWSPPPEDILPPARAGKAAAKAAVPVVPEPQPAPEPEMGRHEDLSDVVAPKVSFAPERTQPEPEVDLPPVAASPVLPEPIAPEDILPEPVAPAPVVQPPEPPAPVLREPEPTVGAGSKRFSDRIKQMPQAEDAPVVEKVPLRTTWKSRGEVAAPPPARKEPEPPAAPAEVAPAESGMNDAAIAAMLAAAAAPPPTQNRVARDRSGREAGLARPAEPAPARERPAGGQLFGGRTPAAAPPVDLSALRAREVPKPAPEPEPEAEEPAPAPVAQAPVRQPRPTETAGRARPPVTARQPAPPRPPAPEPQAEAPPDLQPEVEPDLQPLMVEPVETMPTPRVAVLRDRRPEPAPPERRERPRIAARNAAAPVAAVAAALVDGPLPASEQNLLDQAITLIISRSASLADMIDPEEKLPIDLILEHGRETTEQVIDLLSRGGSAALRRINGDLGEVLDLIMLMQLEKGHAPADDTVTLLLQIRRDLETLRAA
jgi:hypothetical protein